MTSYLHEGDTPLRESRYQYFQRASGRPDVSSKMQPALRDIEDEEEFIMNSHATYGCKRREGTIAERSRKLARQAMRLSVVLLLAGTAFAQYGGVGMGGTTGGAATPGTYTPGTRGYGNGKAIGIGVGAAAAGVGAVYLMTHRATKVTGCTEMSDDGLYLTDDKTNRKLALLPGSANIKAGERVELKGKIRKSAAGDQHFLVKSVAKDFGECHTQASAVR